MSEKKSLTAVSFSMNWNKFFANKRQKILSLKVKKLWKAIHSLMMESTHFVFYYEVLPV